MSDQIEMLIAAKGVEQLSQSRALARDVLTNGANENRMDDREAAEKLYQQAYGNLAAVNFETASKLIADENAKSSNDTQKDFPLSVNREAHALEREKYLSADLDKRLETHDFRMEKGSSRSNEHLNNANDLDELSKINPGAAAILWEKHAPKDLEQPSYVSTGGAQQTNNSPVNSSSSLVAEVKQDLSDVREHVSTIERNFSSISAMSINTLSADDARRMVNQDVEAISQIHDEQKQLHALRFVGANVVTQAAYRAEIEANYEEIGVQAERVYVEEKAKEQIRLSQLAKSKGQTDRAQGVREGVEQDDYEVLDRNTPVNGVVLIDGKSATSVAFVRREEGAEKEYDLTYKMGSKAVHRENGLSSWELERILGRDNAQAIEQHSDVKGVIKGEDLKYAAGLSSEAIAAISVSDVAAREKEQEQKRIAFGDEVRERVADIHKRERQQERNEIINSSTLVQDRGVETVSSAATAANDSQRSEAVVNPSVDAKADALSEIAAKIRDDLNKRYIQTGKDFHFRDQGSDVAFSSGRSSISTEHDKPLVARDMVALAVANGWTAITVKGSEQFKREAWMEASLYGLNVSGYTAREVDLLKLEELKAERDREPKAPKNQIIDNSQQATVDRGDAAKSNVVPIVSPEREKRELAASETYALREMENLMRQRGDSDAAIKMAQEAAKEKLNERSGGTVGRLVEHGAARYQFDKDENPSYFVKLETSSGERMVWGVGLKDAIATSGVQAGELVSLHNLGNKPVVVDGPKRDDDGKVVGRQTIGSHRNQWEVVALDRMSQFAQDRSGMTMRLPQSHEHSKSHQAQTAQPADNSRSQVSAGYADLER